MVDLGFGVVTVGGGAYGLEDKAALLDSNIGVDVEAGRGGWLYPFVPGGGGSPGGGGRLYPFTLDGPAPDSVFTTVPGREDSAPNSNFGVGPGDAAGKDPGLGCEGVSGVPIGIGGLHPGNGRGDIPGGGGGGYPIPKPTFGGGGLIIRGGIVPYGGLDDIPNGGGGGGGYGYIHGIIGYGYGG